MLLDQRFQARSTAVVVSIHLSPLPRDARQPLLFGYPKEVGLSFRESIDCCLPGVFSLALMKPPAATGVQWVSSVTLTVYL